MALTTQALSATNYVRSLDGPADQVRRWTPIPRAIVLGELTATIPAQLAADTHAISITHDLPRGYAYRLQSLSVSAISSSAVNDYDLGGTFAVTNVNHEESVSDLPRYFLLDASRVAQSLVGVITTNVIWRCVGDARSEVWRGDAEESVRLTTALTNQDAAAQPAMVLNYSCLVYQFDVSQAQKAGMHIPTVTLGS